MVLPFFFHAELLVGPEEAKNLTGEGFSALFRSFQYAQVIQKPCANFVSDAA